MESVVRCLEVGYFKLQVFSMEVFLSPEGHGKSDLTDWDHCCTRDYVVKRGSTGRSVDLDNPILLKVFKNKIFKELPPSTRTRLSLTSLMMGQTMRGYRPGFGIKCRWSLRLKVMGTWDHFRYSEVAGETAMISRAMSFYFVLDS
jgi:hypothetical protein